MRLAKYKSFWPLPGGIENYVESLKKVLIYVRDAKPSKEGLTEWFFDTFPDVSKESNVRNYISTTLAHSGLIVIGKKKITLSEDGLKYVEQFDNKFLFQTLDKKVFGFREILEILEKPHQLEELRNALTTRLENAGVKWTSNAQPYWRIHWLQAMGFVTLRDKEFGLTKDGRELLNNTKETRPSSPQPPKLSTYEPVEDICAQLKATEHNSSEPEKYEEAIAEAFSFLGFDVEHRGEPGETDVIATANLGNEKYTVILDGKTTSGNKIIDRHISWPTIAEHREKHQAQYAVVVGPSFAGGDLVNRAKIRYQISLLETDTLIELLRFHSRTPFALTDLEGIFKKVGILKIEECTEIKDKIVEYEKQFELLFRILTKLQELQRRGEPTTVSDLRWALEKKFDADEISEALGILQHLEIVKKTKKEEYIAILIPRVAAAKLKILADIIYRP